MSIIDVDHIDAQPREAAVAEPAPEQVETAEWLYLTVLTVQTGDAPAVVRDGEGSGIGLRIGNRTVRFASGRLLVAR